MLRITCAALLFATTASAEGLTLFGSARLGLGYNITNSGGATGTEDLRAISRVRFGAQMTGESASGITFGAVIRADNAVAGNGGADGQRAGNVFVSGAWGRLTFGDTDGADQRNVGDLNEVGLTCLGCENETPFISNGGGFGQDELNFANNPSARPTLRYDYQLASVGLSVSSNRDLTDIGLGASWAGDLAGGQIRIGAGYYDFAGFTETDARDDPLAPSSPRRAAGHQWSGVIAGEFGDYNGRIIYSQADSEEDADFQTLGAGMGAEMGDWELNAYYVNIIEASGAMSAHDGEDSLGLGADYDLGGGASIRFGVARTYADENVSDLGFLMTF